MSGRFSCLLCFVLFVFVSYGQTERNYTLIIRQAINEKDYDRAKNIFSLAVSEDYYDLSALERLLCRVLYAEKDYQKAFSLAEKLYEEDENDFIVDVIRWVYLSYNKNNDSVIGENIGDYNLKNLDNSILYDLEIFAPKDLKNICLSVNRYMEKKQIDNREDRIPYRTISTLLYFMQKNYMQAYNQAIDIIYTDNVPVMDFVLARIKEEGKEYSSAIAFYNTAIRKGYNNYEAFLHRAICKGYESDYLSANTDLDTCLIIKENHYAYYLKGINYNHLRDYNNALYCFNMSINLCDTFALAYNYRGIVYSNVEKYEIALLDFRTCLALEDKTPYIHDNIAIALERIGKVSEAIEEYLLSVKYEPKYFDAYYNLGRIYTNNHQNRKAMRYLKKALDLETKVPDIYLLIGQNFLEMKKKDKACEYFSTALEMGHTLAQEKLLKADCQKQVQQ